MTAIGTITREAGALCDDQMFRAKEEGILERVPPADEGDDLSCTLPPHPTPASHILLHFANFALGCREQ